MRIEQIVAESLGLSEEKLSATGIHIDRHNAEVTGNWDLVRSMAAGRLADLVIRGEGASQIAKFWAFIVDAERNGQLALNGKLFRMESMTDWAEVELV